MSTIVTRAGKGSPLTHAEVSRLLRYDPETGKLFWLPRGAEWFTDGYRSAAGNCANWNAKHAGMEAFTAVNKGGYKIGSVEGSLYRAHRVIWLLHTGDWPDDEIDHIDGNPANNRWANLRAATGSQNHRNIRAHRDASSVYLGVSWYKPYGKWKAQIMACGRNKCIGYFADEEDAARAYDAAALIHHGAFARPNFAMGAV